VTKLNFGLEHARDGTNGPGDDWLCDLSGLDSLNDAVFFNTTDLTKQNKNFALRISLVAENMVDEGRSRVSIAANGHTFVDTIGNICDDVVKLVGHTTRLGDVCDGTRAVQLRSDDVVHHATSVTDLECTRLNSTNGGRANDGDTLLLGNMENFTGTLEIPVKLYSHM
jgi:hypothetical protein